MENKFGLFLGPQLLIGFGVGGLFGMIFMMIVCHTAFDHLIDTALK